MLCLKTHARKQVLNEDLGLSWREFQQLWSVVQCADGIRGGDETWIHHRKFQNGTNGCEFGRALGYPCGEVFEARLWVDVRQIDAGEGIPGDPHCDETWTDGLAAPRVECVDDAVEDGNADCALSVAGEDSGQAQQGELCYRSGVKGLYLGLGAGRLGDFVPTLDVSTSFRLRDDVRVGKFVLDDGLASVK